MQKKIVSHLKKIKLGAPSSYQNIVVIPITDGSDGAVSYITLTEALAAGVLSVTEISRGGSVPEINVVNSAELPVLMLDGEELAGAKQNRVLNTTVLVPAKQAMVIPVSCTEQGRWAYTTPAFYDSGTVMAHSIRARKSMSVSESLADFSLYRSDQSEIWDGIHELHKAAGMSSATDAMRDVFESCRNSLDKAIKVFPLIDRQIGMLVIINDSVAGFDIISSHSAYFYLHAKLIKSYVVDILAGKNNSAGANMETATKVALAFINRAVKCMEKNFKSAGLGDDYRFQGDHIAGNALICDGSVIHAAFFNLKQEEKKHQRP